MIDDTEVHFDPTCIEDIPPFTLSELVNALSKISNNKASDDKGIIIEIIKQGYRRLHEFLLQCYNNMLRNKTVEDDWHYTIFHMIHKKGSTTDSNNYRAIALLSILYKLFSKMLYDRLLPILNQHQPHDQIRFRPKL